MITPLFLKWIGRQSPSHYSVRLITHLASLANHFVVIENRHPACARAERRPATVYQNRPFRAAKSRMPVPPARWPTAEVTSAVVRHA